MSNLTSHQQIYFKSTSEPIEIIKGVFPHQLIPIRFQGGKEMSVYIEQLSTKTNEDKSWKSIMQGLQELEDVLLVIRDN